MNSVPESAERAGHGRSPRRPLSWRLRQRTLGFEAGPKLMGIVNLTPDSFSDGGQLEDTRAAVDFALGLVEQGADILDIGGESTRPYASPVDEDEEIRRVVPVLEQLRDLTDVPLSIDTSKSRVASLALDLGVEIINDVSGLGGDPAMVAVAREHGAAVCVMHMQGTPQTMQDHPCYQNVQEEVHEYLRCRREMLIEDGIAPDRICLDPGIGFGKTHQHNLTLLANSWRLHALGCTVLVGASRKGFIGKVLGDKQLNRVHGSVGVALALAAQGVQVLRVHDVGAVRQALRLFAAAGGIDGQPLTIEPTEL